MKTSISAGINPVGIIRLFALFVLGLITFSCSAQKTLSEVTSIKGVNSVYIGRAMLKLAGAMDIDAASEVMDMSKFADKLTSIEIVNCEDEKTVKEAILVADKVLGQFPWEIFSEVKDDDASVEISGVFKGNSDIISMLLIKCVEEDELTLILMKGEIDLDTFQAALQE